METKKIVILDFSTAIVYIREVPEQLKKAQSEDVLTFFCEQLNIRENETQYMVGDLEINQN